MLTNIFEEIKAAEKTARNMAKRNTTEAEENRFLDFIEALDNKAEFELFSNERALEQAHRRLNTAMEVAVFNKAKIYSK